MDGGREEVVAEGAEEELGGREDCSDAILRSSQLNGES